jgi:hypothetical protein
MSNISKLHAAVKRGDVDVMRALLDGDSRLANARSNSGAPIFR